MGQVAMRLVELSFVERALVPIRVVRMHYKGRGLDIAPPTIAEFWQIADFAQRTWPAPLPVFCVVRESVEVFDGVFNTQQDSDDPAEIGTTGTIWDILERLKASEGLPADTVYFGFYPNAANPNGGVGGGYLLVAPNVIPGLMAHELGHAQGLPHALTPAFAPTYADADQSFPRYGSLPWGSIGEVGFDPRAGTAFPPPTFDFMGYDLPRWISPHHYQKLFAAVGAPKPGPCSRIPPRFSVDRPPKQRYFNCYYVEGLPGGDFISKLCGPAIPFQPPWPPEEFAGPIRVTLLDARVAAIFEDTFALFTLSEPHDAPRQRGFWITVPELDGATRLVVTLGDKVIEASELRVRPVPFEAKASLLDSQPPAVRVEWAVSPEDAKALVFVRASSDDGRSWTAFNVPNGAKQIDIDPASLPPGNGCVVEVLAGERLRATSWRSEHMPVQTGRDALIVLTPRNDTSVKYGEAIELVATTTYGAGYRDLIWSSDRDGDLGAGGYQLARLSPGEHVLSVRLGECGKRVRAGVVRVVD